MGGSPSWSGDCMEHTKLMGEEEAWVEGVCSEARVKRICPQDMNLKISVGPVGELHLIPLIWCMHACRLATLGANPQIPRKESLWLDASWGTGLCSTSWLRIPCKVLKIHTSKLTLNILNKNLLTKKQNKKPLNQISKPLANCAR